MLLLVVGVRGDMTRSIRRAADGCTRPCVPERWWLVLARSCMMDEAGCWGSQWFTIMYDWLLSILAQYLYVEVYRGDYMDMCAASSVVFAFPHRVWGSMCPRYGERLWFFTDGGACGDQKEDLNMSSSRVKRVRDVCELSCTHSSRRRGPEP